MHLFLKIQKNVIEMLLNNDIQPFFFCLNDFKLSKGNKCNYLHY